MSQVVLETNLPFPRRQGKVRDVYDLGDSLLVVSSDRISAFDWVMPNGIPDKGKLLTKLSLFWFANLGVEHHLLSSDVPDVVKPYDKDGALEGRCMVVRKAKVVPFECVVRGYIEGSGWKDYQETGRICGIELPKGLMQCSQLPSPIFTPATKAEEGHDENVSFAEMAQSVGEDLANELREKTLAVYTQGTKLAAERGIIIADTKLEWGWFDNRIILIDEVLTPDSSRFWPADTWTPGRSQASFDKQFVREFLMSTTWDRNSPPPVLPDSIVTQTRARYVEAYERITGCSFAD
ncbi:MAG: phosphoribosylaminoimidazolesuccinocarboxamide synthase [Pirellula sp.]|jgi:phosphoribosylaminoimidazole-succinocarboxamide synthase|nr:phosphoribosylaminoimidazolesuccinocarboxamide synthase [Pirellula sp.]